MPTKAQLIQRIAELEGSAPKTSKIKRKKVGKKAFNFACSKCGKLFQTSNGANAHSVANWCKAK
tara:strand:- start:138 stop:329 length:192 start_codon:yes stop_codon:yes gene_type:complete